MNVINNVLFLIEKKLRIKIIFLFFLTLIGTFLETLGVGIILPVLTLIVQGKSALEEMLTKTPNFIQESIKNNSTSHNLHIGEIKAELLLNPTDLLSDFLNYLENRKSNDVKEVKRVSLALQTELNNRTMIVGAFVNDIV